MRGTRAYDGRGLDVSTQVRQRSRMTGKDKDRDERLAAALRENLKRRKAQAREIRNDAPAKDA